MPRGVYKRTKKTKAERSEIAKRAAASRARNRRKAEQAEAARVETVIAEKKARAKRFLSDEEKGRVVAYFYGQPGRTYDSWDAVAAEVTQQLGVQVNAKGIERLREAFTLPFDIEGVTDGEAAQERRLQRIEAMLGQIKASVDSWTD